MQKYFRSWFDTSPRTENQLLADIPSVRTEVSKGEKGVLQEAQLFEVPIGADLRLSGEARS